MARARISLGPVLLVNFIGTMGFTIVIPFLVFLVTRYGGNALVYGLVAATYPAFQFIAAPVLGRWSDRYGRKRVLLLSLWTRTVSSAPLCPAILSKRWRSCSRSPRSRDPGLGPAACDRASTVMLRDCSKQKRPFL